MHGRGADDQEMLGRVDGQAVAAALAQHTLARVLSVGGWRWLLGGDETVFRSDSRQSVRHGQTIRRGHGVGVRYPDPVAKDSFRSRTGRFDCGARTLALIAVCGGSFG